MVEEKKKKLYETNAILEKEHWFVLYCKPNTEKSTAKKLERLGIHVYCPTKTEIRQWSDRKKKVEVPVLPSMMLVCVSEKDRNQVFQATTVIRYLFWEGKPAIVRHKEVEALKEALSQPDNIVSIENDINTQSLMLSILGINLKNGQLKYKTKTHLYVRLERLGYIIKIKRD
ncbi:UpxY family transcription antiterminator [Polaribacter sp.]|uniref:UpxY family transcription antiterminator n=1 Tax=Polaribacter sp. TaxID=1920175 RepID=UPI004048AFAB